MATAMLADGMVRHSRAREHIDALREKRAIETKTEVPLPQTTREVTPTSDMHTKGESTSSTAVHRRGGRPAIVNL